MHRSSTLRRRCRAAGYGLVALACAPAAGSTASIDWAETLITTYPNHVTIVTSHFLGECNHSPTGGGSGANGSCAATPLYNLSTYASNLFDRLRAYENFFMMLGGHRFGESYVALDRAAEGFNPVHVVLANYQHLQYSGTNFDTVPIPGPPSGSSSYFKLMRFDMDTMTVDLDSVAPNIAANADISGSGSILPVLSNAAHGTVFSPRDIDPGVPGSLVTTGVDLDTDGLDDPTLHTQSVSNLVNISFAGYVSVGTTTLIDFEIRGDGVTPYASPGDAFPADEYPGVTFADSDPNAGTTWVNSVNPVNVGTPITGHHVNIPAFAGVDTRLTLTFSPAVNAVGIDFATPGGQLNVSVENGGVPVSQLDFIGNDEFTNLAGAPYGAGRVDIAGIGNFDTVIIEPTPNAVLAIDNLEFTVN